MPGQDDFIEALYATVLAGTGAAGGRASGVGYVCLEWPGLPIELADYANALTGDNPTGSPGALEAFPTLVDELPALSPLYQATGASLQTINRLILGATVDSGSVVAQAFAAAKEQFDSLVPTSMIAVRNVRISGTWSAGDRAAAARAMAGGKQAAFGPFTLATPGRVQGSFDGSTLALSGIQVIAWICSRMPVLPP